MGAADEGPAPAGLLCERASRRNGGRLNGHMRRVFRHDRRTGLRVERRRRHLVGDCSGSSRGPVGRSTDTYMIRVVLPWHLRTLARVDSEVMLAVAGQVTQRSVLDALEEAYPVLRGTIRDHVTAQRRPFLRFFACEEDLSHELPDAPLPEAVVKGVE